MIDGLEVGGQSNETLQNAQAFDFIFRQSVLDGLREILGESGEMMLMRNYHLIDPIDNPDYIHKVLVFVFKDVGAVALETVILKKLFGRIGVRFPVARLDGFAAHIKFARSLFELRRRT